MRYLVRAKLKPSRKRQLVEAIRDGTLGQGSVAGGEYLRNMSEARQFPDGTARWVEVCYCPAPLAEERPYWEEFFELVKIQDAHARHNCRDENGTEPWACDDCDCTKRLEERLATQGRPFLQALQSVWEGKSRLVRVTTRYAGDILKSWPPRFRRVNDTSECIEIAPEAAVKWLAIS